MANVTLLRRTLAYIEAHPEEWYQAQWRCGTSACFAGHAALLAGATWINASTKPRDLDHLPRIQRIGVFPPDSDQPVKVFLYAERVLGLDPEQSGGLFDCENTLADLRRIVDELCAEHEAAS